MPHWQTLMRWQRADPGLKARFARARAQGPGVRFQARDADSLRFPAAAGTLVARVRAGQRLSDLIDARGPDRPALKAWKRLSPDFAAAIEDARDFHDWTTAEPPRRPVAAARRNQGGSQSRRPEGCSTRGLPPDTL